MNDIVVGHIVDWMDNGSVVISAPLSNTKTAINRKYNKVLVAFCDGRRISPLQRKKIYALIKDISEWCGEYEHVVKKQMKIEFALTRMKNIERTIFPLSNVDMNTASQFITYLIEFMVENGIASDRPLYELAEDISKYVYACTINRKCCICGLGGADLHHIDAVGTGRDRNEINHIGMRCLPLCREHHNKCHEIGRDGFLGLYHITPITIDENIAKLLGLGKSNG